jgi:glutamate 5-kinase
MSVAGEFTDVMKAGGAVLAPEKDGVITINQEAFSSIGREISEDEGRIVLVSSAAIAAGIIAIGATINTDKEVAMPELQRFAAVGWRHVHNRWADSIEGKETGGLLLTREELSHTTDRNETFRVIQALFASNEVPIVNENDVVAHEEIKFGSNDILSAILAMRMKNSERFGPIRLFLLTDVDGVYEDKNDPETRIPVISDTDDYRQLAVDSESQLRIGGMASKFEAVDIAQSVGIDTWIYNPADGPRSLAVAGIIGTYFPAK